MRPSLRGKLIRGFTIVFLWLLAVELVNISTSRAIERRLEISTSSNLAAANLLSELGRSVQLVHANALLHLYAASEAEMDAHEARIATGSAEVESLMAQLESVSQSQAETDRLAQFRFDWDLFLQVIHREALPASREDRKDEARAAFAPEGSAGKAAQAALASLESLQDASFLTARARMEAATEQQRRGQSLLRALSVLAIAPGLALAVYLIAQVSDAMRLVSSAAQLVAAGDLDWSVSLSTGDEIESVAQSVGQISHQTKQAVAARQEAAEQRQRAIAERRRAERKLATERHRLAVSLSVVNEGVILTDGEGTVTFVNDAACALTGWGPEAAAGKSLEQIFRAFDASTRERRPSPVESIKASGSTVQPLNHTVLVARDGQERLITYRAAPIHDSDGDIVGAAVGISRLSSD